MIVKNNYHWTQPAPGGSPADAQQSSALPFLANGDRCIVQRVRNRREQHGFRFADVTLSFPDYDDTELTATVLLDTLTTDAPALTREQADGLFNGVMETLEGDRRSRFRKLKEDPYFNAIQVKFAYCVTCHKAQGGQWQNVFIDMGGIMPDAFEQLDFHRWLYTALTRARRHVFLVNTPRALLASGE